MVTVSNDHDTSIKEMLENTMGQVTTNFEQITALILLLKQKGVIKEDELKSIFDAIEESGEGDKVRNFLLGNKKK